MCPVRPGRPELLCNGPPFLFRATFEPPCPTSAIVKFAKFCQVCQIVEGSFSAALPRTDMLATDSLIDNSDTCFRKSPLGAHE